VVASAVVDGVDVHAAVVGPVVGEGEDELDAGGLGGLDDVLEDAQVNGDGAVGLEPLEDSVVGTSVVPGEAAGDVGAILVVEGPGTHDLETGADGGVGAGDDILLVVGSPLAVGVSRVWSRWFSLGMGWTHDVEGPEVGVASSEEEVVSVEGELLAVGRDEAGTGGGDLGGGQGEAETEEGRAHVDELGCFELAGCSEDPVEESGCCCC
jgi:hypothetical protein